MSPECSVELTVPQRFAAQVRRAPDATAVIAGDRVLTYRELDDHANRLAQRLVAAGVRPETPVAVSLRRSVELVVSLLAVLKAGGAYVPLDDRAPASRVRQVLDDVGTPLVLTASPGDFPVPVLRPELTTGQASAPEIPCHAEQLAYVMYTSGSTGRPKGVMVSHRALVGFALDSIFDGAAHRRVLMHAPHSFDVVNYELWVPLLRGGQVVLAPDTDVDADLVRRMVAEHAVTGLHLTAGLLRVVADTDPGCLAGVRELLAGGDVVPAAAVRQVLDRVPDLVFRDTYGPTEATTFATSHRVSGPVPDPVPIGVPLDGVRAEMADSGELHLGGTGLARGYHGAPGLTAERFVPDPAGPPGSRVYRVGDLVRRTPAGALVFLGRTDDQVKIRGFRVEPGEVEAAAGRLPEIAQAVVTTTTNPVGDKVLVAHVVPAPGHDVDGPGVLAKLAEVLPDYAVPAAVVALSALPLTGNGKVDRRALPAPDFQDAAGTFDPAADVVGDELETVLRGVVADVLKIGAVAADTHFGLLGADSLTFMRIAHTAKQRGVDLSVKDVFRAPTVAKLAELVRVRSTA